MTLIKHELKQGRTSLIIWTASISFLLSICIFMFPEMKNDMGNIGDMFASMGSFTKAFGMDQVNFGILIGFYAVECGNILGLGGALFASLCAVSSLAKEEKEHTAEFLLSHPIKRSRLITDKLISVFVQIIILNAAVFLVSVVSILAIDEAMPWKELFLLHSSYFIVQIELACVCFGISAFIRRGSIGIGLGIAIIMYFLNIIANISDSAEFLKYITPFGYADGTDIVSNLELNTVFILLGLSYSCIAIIFAYTYYCKKDIY